MLTACPHGEATPSVAERILLTLEACAAGERSLTLKELSARPGCPRRRCTAPAGSWSSSVSWTTAMTGSRSG
jgi:hypothetical protein